MAPSSRKADYSLPSSAGLLVSWGRVSAKELSGLGDVSPLSQEVVLGVWFPLTGTR